MLDHVTIGVGDRERSRAFYDTVLPAVGIRRLLDDETYTEWGDLSTAQAGPGRPVTTRLHVAFAVAGRDDVARFWQAGVDAGYRSDGEPGPRPRYGPEYYGGFLLDPDGNSIEAVVGGAGAAPGRIDHVWFRVADRSASRRFYGTVAPFAAIRAVTDDAELTRYRHDPGEGSFSILEDTEPTTPFHLAFGAPDAETVAEFHRAATLAGYADNGGPGERPEYHEGYFGAFVLDPDGHNVEVVHHARPPR